MKYTAVIIAFTATAGQLFADDLHFIDDLERLQKQRDKEIAAAIEASNRRYQASLEQLSGKATKANALDAALKIKQALEQISNRFPLATGGDIVGVWVVKNLSGSAAGSTGNMDFKTDGTFVASWNGVSGTWEKTDKELKSTFLKDKKVSQTIWFKLPIKDGQLLGINNDGMKVSLTKQSK